MRRVASILQENARRIASTLAVVLGLALLWLFGLLTYEFVYVVIAISGFLLSTFYLATWGTAAIRAWRHGRLKLATLAVLEFVIVPIISIPAFAATLYNLWAVGFATVPLPSIRIARLLGLTALWLIMLIRTAHWISRWSDKTKDNIEQDDIMSDVTPV